MSKTTRRALTGSSPLSVVLDQTMSETSFVLEATFLKMVIGNLDYIYIRKGEGMKLKNVLMFNVEGERQHGDSR